MLLNAKRYCHTILYIFVGTIIGNSLRIFNIFTTFYSCVLWLFCLNRYHIDKAKSLCPIYASFSSIFSDSLRGYAPFFRCLFCRNEFHSIPPESDNLQKSLASAARQVKQRQLAAIPKRNRPFSFAPLPFGKFANNSIINIIFRARKEVKRDKWFYLQFKILIFEELHYCAIS